jgi:GNAT superfamily N-acetyltransferase
MIEVRRAVPDDAPELIRLRGVMFDDLDGDPANPSGRYGYVFNVATDPDCRRRGYSRACMVAVLDWYRERGVRKVDLKATEAGEPLYRSLGFVRSLAHMPMRLVIR